MTEPLVTRARENIRTLLIAADNANALGEAFIVKAAAAGQLYTALKQIVEAATDRHPIPDSDLDDEQPITISTTLGAYRYARAALRRATL